MPVKTTVDKSSRRVSIHVSGAVAVMEVIAAVDAVIKHPDFGPGFEILSDHRDVEIPLTPDATKSWLGHLERAAEKVRGCRWAAVATNPASYGMMRMLSVLIKELLVLEVFETMEDAERWLATSRSAEG